MAERIQQGIEMAVRGFRRLFVREGDHDIFESIEVEEGRLFARAYFSFAFWGYSIPSQMEEFRRQVFALESTKIVKGILEEVTGPLQSCMDIEG